MAKKTIGELVDATATFILFVVFCAWLTFVGVLIYLLSELAVVI